MYVNDKHILSIVNNKLWHNAKIFAAVWTPRDFLYCKSLNLILTSGWLQYQKIFRKTF